ncbi:wax ester/triacylglycerol synthase family O-acyltransferase [Ramlibacter sp.]|uniref:wax ester/triacylglycerol synthase family O-acyltransferase n=1 Tax=Ramlibacter sp. TaxID=1917967 RepID=UPI002D2541FB|nr:wax ester/triacylglycerol synthase family O-acyltransferase [Ramlibacter sp.]HYD76760.1 wax ester/triacylglycerol synthase family O-acyltransferase [Ramlibacter sp.]
MVTRIVRDVAQQAAQRAARGAVKKATRAARGVLGLAGERMSKVDTAWLRMDSDHNLMMILGVWTLRPGIAYEALCHRVEERLMKYPRFRQHVVEDAAGASWVDTPDLDVRQLVVREKLPRSRKGGAQAALQARVGELAMQPLDRRLPLWRIHLVEGYDGGSALIVRIHHCIADGIALISVALSLVDGGAPPPQRKPREAQGPEDWIADALLKPFTGLAVKALDAAGDGAARSLHLLGDPHAGLEGSVELARLAWQVLSDAGSLLLMPDDSKTLLKGQPSGRKRVAWCEPLPLDEVKAVGKALNCSINDVLLSCVSGAIGQYLLGQGDDPAGKEIRAMVPVNLRPMDQAWKLGNHFGLVPLVLPIGLDNPVERVYEVRRRMNELKGSTQPLLAFAVLTVAGLLVKPAQDAILGLFSDKTTAVMTNVPGPRDTLRLLGATLEQCMFWVPQSGNIGLGVSILSYGGHVQFGVITDAALCPQPQKIIDAFAPEFAKLSWLTLMLPWGEE